jgi:hypothetical protein
LTVTVKVHWAVNPIASVPVQVTVVVPRLKVAPEAGAQATVAPGQLSLTVGGVKVTVAVQTPASVLVVMFDGQAPSVGF